MVSIGEYVCKTYFETIFKKPFIRIRPTWLQNENGNRLELDGYCAELMLVFEYNGGQHYIDYERFNKIPFAKRQEWDRLKVTICAQKGVRLIVIPTMPNMLSLKDLKTFIRSECETQSVELPADFDHIIIDEARFKNSSKFFLYEEVNEIIITKNGKLLSSFVFMEDRVDIICNICNIGWNISIANLRRGKWCPNCAKTKKLSLECMMEIAAAKGGKCLSTEYTNAHTKLEWECAEGHRWLAEVTNIRNNNRWCPDCAGHTKLTIEEMQALAATKGGVCLSTEYKNAHCKLQWQCSEGHIWWTEPMHIKKGRGWCMECNGRWVTIERMQKLAEFKNGSCLSTEYIPKIKLKFQCSEGHTWSAKANEIKLGNWCPTCSGNIKSTIDQMQTMASNNDGKCLSTEYINMRSKLEWECSEGHAWLATPSLVKSGYWCRVCAKLKKQIKRQSIQI